MHRIISKNPFTKVINKQFQFISDIALNQQIKNSHQAYLINSSFSLKQRCFLIQKLAQILPKHADKLAQLIASQMGKPIIDARLEVIKSMNHCKYYASHAQQFLRTINKKTQAKKTLISFQPLGVVHLVVPFNFSFWLNFKPAIPIILSGNSLLVRNSNTTPLIGLAIEQIFKQAYDLQVYNPIFNSYQQYQTIINHQNVVGVSFTGSDQTGSIIAQKAGKALKKTILELGGNDPMVITQTADLDKAADCAVKARVGNSGQTCIAPKKFIINSKVYNNFKQKIIERIQKLKWGNPLDAQSQVGPMARQDLLEMYNSHISKLPNACFSYKRQAPFASVHIIEMKDEFYKQQIFGPAFLFYQYQQDQQAVRLCNNDGYGLGASVWGDPKTQNISKKIKAGMVFVNQMTKSDSRVPFGGIGKSGYGRQCGQQGIRAFTNIKTTWIA